MSSQLKECGHEYITKSGELARCKAAGMPDKGGRCRRHYTAYLVDIGGVVGGLCERYDVGNKPEEVDYSTSCRWEPWADHSSLLADTTLTSEDLERLGVSFPPPWELFPDESEEDEDVLVWEEICGEGARVW